MTEKEQSWIEWGGNHSKSLMSIIGLVVMIFSGAAYAFDYAIDQIDDRLDVLKAELKVEIKVVADDVTDLRDETGRNFARTQEQIDDQKITPKIAEYDEVRSGVVGGKCRIGGKCKAEYRLRRTIRGNECGKPTPQRRLRNHNGNTFPVKSNPDDIIRADGEWIIADSNFVVPTGVKPGRGEYFIRLSYPDCPWMEPGLEVRETTPVLKFEILPAS